MVESGLAPTLSKASALIMSGIVLADNRRIEKPSEIVDRANLIRLKGDSAARKYVGRGGIKLEYALNDFSIDATGLHCLDIGSSTGGFTDCLLQHGAARVVAVDAGTNQLDWRIRSDERVEVRENTNARNLTPSDFGLLFDLIVVDVSFISVKIILPVLPTLLANGGRIVILIKPQFEVARGEVGDGGIVRDEILHSRVVSEVQASAQSLGFRTFPVTESPILGMEGNKEFLAVYEK